MVRGKPAISHRHYSGEETHVHLRHPRLRQNIGQVLAAYQRQDWVTEARVDPNNAEIIIMIHTLGRSNQTTALAGRSSALVARLLKQLPVDEAEEARLNAEADQATRQVLTVRLAGDSQVVPKAILDVLARGHRVETVIDGRTYIIHPLDPA